MSRMTELAKENRVALKTTPEELEGRERWGTIIRYGDRILVAGHRYQRDGLNWIGMVYEFLDDDATDVEDFIGIREISAERFEDTGHAIEWAIKNAYN